MRAYTTQDLFSLVEILDAAVKAGDVSLASVLTAAAPAGGDAPAGEQADTGAALMQLLGRVLWAAFARHGELTKAWFASLNEMSVEEFKNAPPELVTDTIKEIVSRKESKDFFSRAYQQFSGMFGS